MYKKIMNIFFQFTLLAYYILISASIFEDNIYRIMYYHSKFFTATYKMV